MKALTSFIFLGLLTAIPGEILNQIFARRDVHAFWTTMVSYTVLLFLGFFIGKLISAVARNRSRAAIAHYLLFGSLGLSVEWFLLGNAPVLDPFQIVVQPGMFTFWGTMLLAPWLLRESAEFSPLKRAFVKYFVSFSGIYLMVGGLLPRERGGIFIAFIIFAVGYVGLNTYFWRYFVQLAAKERGDGAPPAP